MSYLINKSSIYIHIPFCISKCYYCDFYSIPVDNNLITPYIKALIREINLRSNKQLSIETIYLGGGTPCLLDVGEIDEIMSAIYKGFKVVNGCEITIEANPLSFDLKKALHLKQLGINRISLGIQSLNDSDLSILGRSHNSHQAMQSILLVKEAGFENISLDLIYGIPNQDIHSWEKSLNHLIQLRPHHISTYELTTTEGTVLHSRVKNKEVLSQSDEVIEELYIITINFLSDAGYIHYEVSNFCLNGFHCKHNWNYWTRGRYLGFGASAHSFDGHKRSYNYNSINEYIKALNTGRLPIEEEEFITEDIVRRERIFLGLRTNQGIEKGMLKDKDSLLMELLNNGLVEVFDDRIRLTERGFILSNEIILQVL